MRRFLFILVTPVCLLSEPAAAQVLYGTIVGNVRDRTGSAVPSASVAITSRGTGLSRQSRTNEIGYYTFSDLPPGAYNVEVGAPGFRTSTQAGVAVSINTVSRVDIELEVGAVTESVEVSAMVTPLQTDKTDVHVELGNQEINYLPLPAYRNYQSLFALVPGASPPRFQNAIMDSPGRSLTTNVNGTIRNTNFTRSDGASNIQAYLRHHTVYVEPTEAIESVSITTNNFDAEQGLAGGAAITVATKSGTNDMHGTVFEFHDNQHLRARNFFLRTPQKPKSINNIYGANLGGPIRKNKLFYFANWEATRERLGYSGVFTVPTAALKEGDFSTFGTQIYDPTTGAANGTGRTAFPNARVPLDRQSQITRKLQAMIPLPNQPGTTSNFFAAGPQALTRDNVDAKINWNKTDRFVLWGKYSRSLGIVDINPALGEAGGPSLGSGGTGRGHTLVQVGTLGYTYTLTPRMVLDGNLGFSRFGQNVKGRDFGKNIGLDVLGIPGTNGGDIRQSGFPIFAVSSFTNLGNVDNWSPTFRNDNTYTHTTNLGWSRGQHDIRVGFDIRRFHVNHWQPEAGGGPRGRFGFAGGTTALSGGASPNQFNSYAQFLLGLPDNMQKSLQYFAPMGTREWQMGWYVRDRWQATRNLTLTLGLRYEYFPLMTRPWSGIERYDLDTNKVLVGRFGNIPDNAGTSVSKKLFGPRLGIAYRATSKTVIRTGYGISVIPDLMSALMRSPYPIVIAQEFTGANSFQPYRPIEQGIPLFSGPDFRPGTIDIPSTVQTVFLPKGEMTRGYIQSWNFIIQRELKGGIVTDVGYVGTSTVHQFAGWDQNSGFPGSGTTGRLLVARTGRTTDTNLLDGMISANYHALQISLNRRFNNGAFLKGAYTFSKTIDFNDESGSDSGGSTLTWNWAPVVYRNRALAGYDRNHVLQMGWGYELPFGPGKRWANGGGALGAFTRGWRITGIFSSYTGTPFTVSSSATSLNAPKNAQTADQARPEVKKLGGIGTEVAFFDPLSFDPVTGVRFGTSGRNILRGPGLVNLNLDLFKAFPLTERWKLEFRAESYNLTNTPHFSNPGANVSNRRLNSDGSVAGLGGFMSVTGAAADERQFRFGLHLRF